MRVMLVVEGKVLGDVSFSKVEEPYVKALMEGWTMEKFDKFVDGLLAVSMNNPKAEPLVDDLVTRLVGLSNMMTSEQGSVVVG